MSSVCRLRDAPLPLVPSPQGDLLAPDNKTLVSPAALLDVFHKLGRHIEALELAVMSAPERVAELIEQAGPAYQEQGLLARLHLLLESLDDVHRRDEKVLEWRLVAGFNQKNYLHLMPIIEAHLEDNEAPALRSRYAGALPNLDARFAQAQRAAAAAKTPLTLFQLGCVHPDNEASYENLRHSVNVAEAAGRPYEISRNAGALAYALIYMGRFREAESWAHWALQVFDKEGLKDGERRLHLLHSYATARTLMGRTKGLRNILLEASDAARTAELNAATLMREVLANLELVLGNLQEAEEIAAENYDRGPRYRLGDLVVPLVRILLEQGKVEEARVRAQNALTLTAGELECLSLPASLALGMVYSFTKPDSARSLFVSVLKADDIDTNYRIMAALHLLKIGGVQLGELNPELQEILRTLTPTGFRLFCGPESAFSGVWNTLTDQCVPLRMRVLGQKEVVLNGQSVQLSERALETLVLLALHPEGLTPEALHIHLYESEEIKLSALRVVVSRLRPLVPISTHSGLYQITEPFSFDVHDCEKAIDAGDVRAALELYRGPLLENSDAPGIREARLILEEKLRQGALGSGDASVLLPLAQTMRDDRELWEATHAALPVNDARLPLVRAQLRRVTQDIHPTYN